MKNSRRAQGSFQLRLQHELNGEFVINRSFHSIWFLETPSLKTLASVEKCLYRVVTSVVFTLNSIQMLNNMSRAPARLWSMQVFAAKDWNLNHINMRMRLSFGSSPSFKDSLSIFVFLSQTPALKYSASKIGLSKGYCTMNESNQGSRLAKNIRKYLSRLEYWLYLSLFVELVRWMDSMMTQIGKSV